MRYQGALVFLLIFAYILSGGNGDVGSDFLNTKQEEVQSIALAAQDNYLNLCELVSTCQTAQKFCSRLECYPPANQSRELTCVYVSNNNSQCHNTTGPECSTLEANFVRGYVRTPPLDYGFFGYSTAAAREQYLGSSICTQRKLDSTFITVNSTLRSSSSIDYFYNLYFGAADGSFRFYPGRELLTSSCGVYDPRQRPWYTGATSILKDVVILIDTGSSMQLTDFFETSSSYLELTQALVEVLVKTITVGDRVTVIPVNASGSVVGQPYSQYNVPRNWDFSDPNFQGLLNFIANNSAFAENGGSDITDPPTNFTDGFLQAASTFAASSPPSSMQIVMLFTNSHSQNSPNSVGIAAANNLTSSGVKIFAYDLNPSSSTSGKTWGKYACDDGIHPASLAVNPLLFLNSYFSFLARARIAVSTGSLVYWEQPYRATTTLGAVITVAYPAMSADGLQLIGVAGIDVELAGLQNDPLLLESVEQLLSIGNYSQIAVNPKAGNLSICTTKYLDVTSCSNSSMQTESLCYPTAEPASDDELLDLLCCPQCLQGGKSDSNVVWIILGVLGGLSVSLCLSIIYLIRRKKKRDQSKRSTSFALPDFSYETLRKATNGFHKSNMVGKGSFGVVYKARIADETVAVKQLNQPADRAEDFKAEIKILGFTNHPNLVELKGTCFQPAQCFLVYEFLESGDLHEWLWPTSPPGEQRFLTWNQRRIIARGVARGINYLHRGLEPNGAVFHLDIKPHNILLEYNFNPKIADFGISQVYEPGYTCQIASVVRGTFGYIAPEVLQGRVKPNSKLDVYSYGMVLLQLVSGRKIDDPEAQPFLLQWAKDYVEDGHVEKVVDVGLLLNVQEQSRNALIANCKILANLALRCLSERPESRPEMSGVLETIDKLAEVVELQTPSISDDESDYQLGSQRLHEDAEELVPRSGNLIPFGRQKVSGGHVQNLEFEAESRHEGSIAENPEITTSLTPSEGPGSDFHYHNISSGPSETLGSSSDSSLRRLVEMSHVQNEQWLNTQ